MRNEKRNDDITVFSTIYKYTHKISLYSYSFKHRPQMYIQVQNPSQSILRPILHLIHRIMSET